MTNKKRKKKPLKTSDKIALALLVFEVIKWLADFLLNLKK